MNGNRAVLDSNVIIDASKGVVSIQEIVAKFDYLFISIISYIEVLGYQFSKNDEKLIIVEILNLLPIIYIDKNIADISIEI